MNRRTTAATAAFLATALAATSCGSDSAVEALQAAPAVEVQDVAYPARDTSSFDTSVPLDRAVLATALLSEADRDGLAFMREEEKLAGDVYQAMYDAWGLPIFDNIAAAEQKHTQAVVDLLDQYEVPDPAEDLGPGEFANADLQALYDELVETGSQSSTAALEVGALIEELDITDLRLRASDQADIDMVYSTLERASSNHLRAFNRQLERRGVTYSPVYLDQAVFDEIVDSPTESGRAQQRGADSNRSRGNSRSNGQGPWSLRSGA